MIPVDQTRFSSADGNCMEACVASVLECDLSDVPNLSTCGDSLGWVELLNEFLAPRGLAYAECGVNHGVYSAPGVICIASGPSPRIDGFDHACVAETLGRGIRVIHDPHPSRVGLPKGKTAVGFFVSLRPQDGDY